MEKNKDFYYKARVLRKINMYPHEGIRFLDWEGDFELINQYYIDAFGITDMQRHNNDDAVKVVALLIDNKIVSQSVILTIRENELEIGAVSTIAKERNKGYSRAVVSAAAKYIIEQGTIASSMTASNNLSMQRVAELVGMERVFT